MPARGEAGSRSGGRKTGRSLALSALLLHTALLVGCARAPGKEPFSAADVRAHPELAAWLKLWTPPLEPLTASSFRFTGEGDRIGSPIGNGEQGSFIFPSLEMAGLVCSPDSAWVVDCWSAQDEDHNPVVLLNRRTRKSYLISDCGYSCAMRMAVWIDASHLLLAGWEDTNEAPFDRIEPILSRFDLNGGRVRTYRGLPMDAKYVPGFMEAEEALLRSTMPRVR